MGWIGFFVCLLIIIGLNSQYHEYFDQSFDIEEKYHSLNRDAPHKIAIIKAVGVLADSNGFVKHQIDRVRQDERVKGIVLRVDSPGGTVTASDFMYHHLNLLRKEQDLPLVVSMGSMAASGGYYISMTVGDQEDAIFAEPTTTTGSIGVIIPHYDLTGLMKRLDVQDDSIVSNPRKQMLSMTREHSSEDREILQAYVDDSFRRFKEIVQSGRPKFRADPEALDRLATGEIFTAERAVENGLVDKIGFIESAIERTIELAGLEKEDVMVVTYKQPESLVQAAGFAQQNSGFVDSWLDLAVPRAYYLLTTLPGLSSARVQP